MVAFKCSEGFEKAMSAAAKFEGISVSELIRSAVEFYIKEQSERSMQSAENCEHIARKMTQIMFGSNGDTKRLIDAYSDIIDLTPETLGKHLKMGKEELARTKKYRRCLETLRA